MTIRVALAQHKQSAALSSLHYASTRSSFIVVAITMPLSPSITLSESVTPSDSVSRISYTAPTLSCAPSLNQAVSNYGTPPDSFTHDRVKYIRRATINKKSSNTSSAIWKFGERFIRQSDGKEVFYCYECAALNKRQELFVCSGTGHTAAHLKKAHKIVDGEKQSSHEIRQQRPTVLEAMRGRFYYKDIFEQFKELLVNWIVFCHIAFHQIEDEHFRKILFFLSPGLAEYLPAAAQTIRDWVIMRFQTKKDILRKELQHARSRVSISFDLWTSPNSKSVLGVIAMWIDGCGRKRSTVLGIRQLHGEHGGENQAQTVLELLKEYEINGAQIGYFMLDNAQNNDTAVELHTHRALSMDDSKAAAPAAPSLPWSYNQSLLPGVSSRERL